jgi:putative PIN family toxin of toxin-antitoxin system
VHKVVIDANVWISALLDGKNALSIVDKLGHDQFQLMFAEPLIIELTDVLSRPKFAKIRPGRSEQLIALIREKATLIALENIPKVSRDPKDDVYLACAVASQADFLVSGDDDLLTLKEHQGTKIVTPRQFLETFTSQV